MKATPLEWEGRYAQKRSRCNGQGGREHAIKHGSSARFVRRAGTPRSARAADTEGRCAQLQSARVVALSADSCLTHVASVHANGAVVCALQGAASSPVRQVQDDSSRRQSTAHLVCPEEGRQAGQGHGGGVEREPHHVQLLVQHLQPVMGM